MRAQNPRERLVLSSLLLGLLCSCVSPRDDLGGLAAEDERSAKPSPMDERPQIPPEPRPPSTPADGPIYVHGPSTLYKFEPRKAMLTRVGEFDCVLGNPAGTADSGMHDLAIDSRGRLFGIAKVGGAGGPDPYSNQVIVSIDKDTASCRTLFALDNKLLDARGGLEVRGLSFIPAGILPSPRGEESLVALEIYGAYLQIDLSQQQATRIGSLNGDGGDRWRTKGADIVSIQGDATYSTAQTAGSEERLVVLDPATGQVQRDIGPLDSSLVGGLAYWEGKLYGFTSAGRIVSIDPGSALLTDVPVAVPSGVRFDGAAVTPSAPIFPPG
jgi:hypothetical protein